MSKKKVIVSEPGLFDEETILMSQDELSKSSVILPNDESGRYGLRRVLGRGAFGVVYLAEDREIGRLVAIKKLFDAYADSEEMLKRFRQEAKIAGQLEHPNIVIVYNVEGGGKSSSIIMEYLGGGGLDGVMERHPKVPFHLAARIMLGIMTGLDAAHHLGVVHRDIKPQNILFGVGTTPKITDFGVAHLPPQSGGFQELVLADRQTSMIGTPLYMSPEQAAMTDVDCRTDIYSAGVIFYEMLTNNRLFSITERKELARIHDIIMAAVPRPIGDFRDNVPDGLDDVVSKMLAKDPAQRYGQAIDVIRDLIGVMANVVVEDPVPIDITSPLTEVVYSPAAILEDIIYLLLLDGIITPEERAELDERTEKLGISGIHSRAIENRLRQKMGLPTLDDIDSFKSSVADVVGADTRPEQWNAQTRQDVDELQHKHGIPAKEYALFLSVCRKRADKKS